MKNTIFLLLLLLAISIIFSQADDVQRINIEQPMLVAPQNWEELDIELSQQQKEDIKIPITIFLTSNPDGEYVIKDVARALSDPIDAYHYRQFYTLKEVSVITFPLDAALIYLRDWLIENNIISNVDDFWGPSIEHSYVYNAIRIPNVSLTKVENLLQCKFKLYQHKQLSQRIILRTLSYSIPQSLSFAIDFITPTMHFDETVSTHQDQSTLLDNLVKQQNLFNNNNNNSNKHHLVTPSDIYETYKFPHFSSSYTPGGQHPIKIVLSSDSTFQCNLIDLDIFLKHYNPKSKLYQHDDTDDYHNVELILDFDNHYNNVHVWESIHDKDGNTRNHELTKECNLMLQWISSLSLDNNNIIIQTILPHYNILKNFGVTKAFSSQQQGNTQKHSKLLDPYTIVQIGDTLTDTLFSISKEWPVNVPSNDNNYDKKKHIHHGNNNNNNNNNNDNIDPQLLQQTPAILAITTLYDEQHISSAFKRRIDMELAKLAAVGTTTLVPSGIKYACHHINNNNNNSCGIVSVNTYYPSQSENTVSIAAVVAKKAKSLSDLVIHPSTGVSQSLTDHISHYKQSVLNNYYEKELGLIDIEFNKTLAISADLAFIGSHFAFYNNRKLHDAGELNTLATLSLAVAYIAQINRKMFDQTYQFEMQNSRAFYYPFYRGKLNVVKLYLPKEWQIDPVEEDINGFTNNNDFVTTAKILPQSISLYALNNKAFKVGQYPGAPPILTNSHNNHTNRQQTIILPLSTVLTPYLRDMKVNPHHIPKHQQSWKAIEDSININNGIYSYDDGDDMNNIEFNPNIGLLGNFKPSLYYLMANTTSATNHHEKKTINTHDNIFIDIIEGSTTCLCHKQQQQQNSNRLVKGFKASTGFDIAGFGAPLYVPFEDLLTSFRPQGRR